MPTVTVPVPVAELVPLMTVLLASSVPLLVMVVPPLKVLDPVSVRVPPEPIWAKLPVPLMTVLTV